MTLMIEVGDPHDPQATALLEASHALMESLFPPEDNHFLSIDALCTLDIHFFIARDGDSVLGCAAIADRSDYGEIKSMFVSDAARGKGVADALMRQLEDHARSLGLSELKLETGDLLHAAHKLYERYGFSRCDPFGDYTANASSIFMEKQL